MTLAAIDWLSISINLLLVLFVIVCLLMTLLILMQRPKQEGLGAAFGAGVTDQVFGARTTNVLQRGTVYLGTLFFVISLALAVLIGQKNKNIKIAREEPVAAAVEEATPTPEDESLKPKSLLEELPEETPAAIEDATPAPADETPAPAEDTAPAPEDEATPADADPANTTPANADPADATIPAGEPGTPEEQPGQP